MKTDEKVAQAASDTDETTLDEISEESANVEKDPFGVALAYYCW